MNNFTDVKLEIVAPQRRLRRTMINGIKQFDEILPVNQIRLSVRRDARASCHEEPLINVIPLANHLFG